VARHAMRTSSAPSIGKVLLVGLGSVSVLVATTPQAVAEARLVGANDPVYWNQTSFNGGYVNTPYQWPDITVGRLNYKDENGAPKYCTATVINTESQATLITAAHCLNSGGDAPTTANEGDGAYAGKWHSDFLFIPAYDGTKSTLAGRAPYGAFSWLGASVTYSWYWHENYHDDIGFVRLGLNAANHTPLYEVGGMGYILNEDNSVQRWTYVQGHPLSYNNGVQQRYADGYLDRLVNDTPAKDGDGYEYQKVGDLTQGASGGPWYTGNMEIFTVFSYFYTYQADRMHGSYMNAEAQAALKAEQ
jgi:V8-like Glu-specific endopeptidase